MLILCYMGRLVVYRGCNPIFIFDPSDCGKTTYRVCCFAAGCLLYCRFKQRRPSNADSRGSLFCAWKAFLFPAATVLLERTRARLPNLAAFRERLARETGGLRCRGAHSKLWQDDSIWSRTAGTVANLRKPVESAARRLSLFIRSDGRERTVFLSAQESLAHFI